MSKTIDKAYVDNLEKRLHEAIDKAYVDNLEKRLHEAIDLIREFGHSQYCRPSPSKELCAVHGTVWPCKYKRIRDFLKYEDKLKEATINMAIRHADIEDK